MTVNTASMESACDIHQPAVKLKAGASIVKVKPLFTFDSKYILVASGCAVKVFSILSGECVLTFEEHKFPIVSLHSNPNNHLQVLSCSEDGTVIRWDYSDGKALKHYNLAFSKKVAMFYCPESSNNLWIATTSEELGHCNVYSIKIKGTLAVKKFKIMNPVLPRENALAIGPKCSYVAGVYKNSLLLYNMKTRESKRHKIDEAIELLCIACHPSDNILATGDSLGRIIVWADMLQSNHPTRSIYHWHSLPLPDLVFSPEGSHIYSAGGESVLVKWNLNTGTKQTLPRLGLPICQVAVSFDNSYIATSHIDNAVHIINSHNIVAQVIQGLTQGHCQKLGDSEIVLSGMIYDPRTKSLLMNGRPGHVQFYDIVEDKQLFQLDIIGQNFICHERDSTVINTDIEKVVLSSSGLWLATVECRDDQETSPQIRLKFWHFDQVTQKFTLNTNIVLPHNKKINCLKFQPEKDKVLSIDRHSLMAITTSADNRFKIWTLSEKSDRKSSWVCEQMGYYKDMPAGDACFSEDGSLLCIAFDHVATLWLPDANVLKTSLHIPHSTNPIKSVLFGRKSCNHFLVCHTFETLIVWDIITLSVLWRVQCNITYCIDNSMSEIMAAFTDDGKLFIFSPASPEPIFVLKDTSKEPIVSAVFVPQNKKDRPSCCWQQHSRLFMLNQKQELLTVTNMMEEKEVSEKVEIQSLLPMTPFASLQAEHSATGVMPIKEKFHSTHKGSDQEILDYPCPTNVNTIALCKVVLSSLLRKDNSCTQPEEDKLVKEPHQLTDDEIDSDDENPPHQSSMASEHLEPKQTYSPLSSYSFLLDSIESVE